MRLCCQDSSTHPAFESFPHDDSPWLTRPLMMDDQARILYENKCKDSRAELKRWENEWAQSHDGAKPGRQDIKNNPDIGECTRSESGATILKDCVALLTTVQQPRNTKNTIDFETCFPAKYLPRERKNRSPQSAKRKQPQSGRPKNESSMSRLLRPNVSRTKNSLPLPLRRGSCSALRQ